MSLHKLLPSLKFRARAQTGVLMYHRVATLPSDIWNIAVDPTTFEQHLRLLKKKVKVVSVAEVVEALVKQATKRNCVALTFDDGYADNFLTAKPLLDCYDLPATFFIASQNIGQPAEFWWDELEHILLFTERLPQTLSLDVSGLAISFLLGTEAYLSKELRRQHQQWNACQQPPPTGRGRLFFQLWQHLRALPYLEQQRLLHLIRAWAGVGPSSRPGYRSMSREQLQILGRSRLHTLGAHTVTHPALPFHSADYQGHELAENKAFLEQATGQSVELVAYPYGDHNPVTTTLTASLDFKAGFTTVARPIRNTSDRYSLGRFEVTNVPAPRLAEQLNYWLRSDPPQ